jgi:restriction system protein
MTTVWSKGLATVGQYVVPLICLAGAAVSTWRRRQGKDLVADVRAGEAADVVDGMSWREFEMLVGEAFRLRGYRVTEQGGAGPDGGVDLMLAKGSEKFLVQCKQWRAFRVGVEVVRELYGVMAARGAAGGFVVTSGRFTDDAVAFAAGRNVHLVDGRKLHEWIAGVRRTASSAAVSGAESPSAESRETACPVCSKPMVRRRARQGSNIGTEFWGCTSYPSCRGTRPIA